MGLQKPHLYVSTVLMFFILSYQIDRSNFSKLKFWSNDDSPVIRPAVLTPKWPKGYNAPVPPKAGVALSHGTGECERVTVLMARSNYSKLANFVVLTILGASVFGGLILIKGKKENSISDVKSLKN